MSFWRLLRKVWRHRNDELVVRYTAVGMNSTVDAERDRHVLLADYDAVPLERVIDSVKELQRFWNLSDAYVFRTRNGYHIMWFYDIMPFGRVKLILEYASWVDPMFKFISRYYNYKTIRVQGKYPEKDIRFVGIVYGDREPTQEEWDIGEL